MVAEMMDRRRTCHHEACHAVVALALDQPVHCIEVYDGGGGAFYARQPTRERDEDERRRVFDVLAESMRLRPAPSDEDWIGDRLVVLLAGLAAEFRMCGYYPGGEGDAQDIEELLGVLPAERREAIREAATKRTNRLVEANWGAISRVADQLYWRGRLEGPEIRAIAGNVTRENSVAPNNHIYPVYSGGQRIGEVLRRNVDGLTYAAIPAAGGVIGYFDDLIEAAHAVGAASPAGSIRFRAAEDDRRR